MVLGAVFCDGLLIVYPSVVPGRVAVMVTSSAIGGVHIQGGLTRDGTPTELDKLIRYLQKLSRKLIKDEGASNNG